MSAAEQIIAKLRDPDAVFTTSEVAYLMSRAGRWGYEHRGDEENGTYPPPPITLGRAWINQVDYRRRCDVEARKPRSNDHAGGPVTWERAE
jgi:hypothetical protein